MPRWLRVTLLSVAFAVGVAILPVTLVAWLQVAPTQVPVPTFPPPPPIITYEITGAGEAMISATDETGQAHEQGRHRLPWARNVTTSGKPWVTAAATNPRTVVACKLYLNGRLEHAGTARGSVTCPSPTTNPPG